MFFVKAVISLEHIQICRYTLEPTGTFFLRWCLLFPSVFFGDFVGALARRHADMQIRFPFIRPKQSMHVILVDPNHPATSAACRMVGERMPRVPLHESPSRVAKTKAKVVMHDTPAAVAARPAAVFNCADYATTAGSVALPALSVNSSSSSASDNSEMTGGNHAALGPASQLV